MDLNERQLDFLKEELNITEEDIEKMTADKWESVREQCFWIEVDELMEINEKEEKEGRLIEEETERCRLATSIIDYEGSFPWDSENTG